MWATDFCAFLTGGDGSDNLGGLCGVNNGTITNCYATGSVTTSQLQQQSTFTDWDFIHIWAIGENQTYPYLRKYSAADVNQDGSVNLIDLGIMSGQWMEGVE